MYVIKGEGASGVFYHGLVRKVVSGDLCTLTSGQFPAERRRGNVEEGLAGGGDADNLLLGSSAGAPKRLRLFPEQTEGGQATAVRKECERGNFKIAVQIIGVI